MNILFEKEILRWNVIRQLSWIRHCRFCLTHKMYENGHLICIVISEVGQKYSYGDGAQQTRHRMNKFNNHISRYDERVGKMINQLKSRDHSSVSLQETCSSTI